MNKKRKLVIATDCFVPRWDGISRFLIDIIPELNTFDITVIAPDFPGTYETDIDAKIIRIPLSNIHFGDFTVSKKCNSAMEKAVQDADIVWVHTLSRIGRAAVTTGKKYSKKVIFYIHSIDWELVIKSLNLSNPIKTLSYPFIRWSVLNNYKKCSLLMSPEQNVEDILEWHNIEVPRVRVALGVNVQRFSFPKNKKTAKELINISPENKIIGFCGRISHEKDIETLLVAFKRIRAAMPNVQLLIVGTGIKEYEKKLRREKQVLYVGQKDNVVPYLQAMDIFVLPSLVETTSLATLEAMACGAVPICTPVGYVKEYIKEKVNGMLFPFKNSTVLYIKLKQLLEEDELRKQLSEAARLTVQQKFNLIQTKENVKKILNL
jgi:glycosyltransferase involved in cell wall biosynthesis